MTFYGINTFEVWISGQRRREFDWQEMTGEKKKKKNLTLIGLLLSSHGIFMLHYKTITNVSPGGNRDSVVLGCITKQPDGTTERRSKEQHTVHMVCLFTFDLLPSFLSEQQQRAWRSCVGSTDGERGGAGWSGVVPLMRVSDCRLIRRLSLSQGGITLKHDSSETRALSVSLSTDPRPQEKKKKKKVKMLEGVFHLSRDTVAISISAVGAWNDYLEEMSLAIALPKIHLQQKQNGRLAPCTASWS